MTDNGTLSDDSLLDWELAFSPDSSKLVTVGDAGVVTLWDMAIGVTY